MSVPPRTETESATQAGVREMNTAPLLEVRNLVKHFPVKNLVGLNKLVVRAVDDISFRVHAGETLGVVGESGCGKSTTARLLMHLLDPSSGEIIFDGMRAGSRDLPLKEFRRQVQMVFQDSYASLNPRMTIESSIAFGARVHGISAQESISRAHELLDQVGLDHRRFAGRYPHELSGGQRQRVNIARALAVQPRLLILDEAVSALDKSVEAQVLNLLSELKQRYGLTYIFISHDLHVVRYVSDRVMVMYLGEVVEIGPSETLFQDAAHPYTRALIASMPSMDPDRRTETVPLGGDPPNPINPPSGCRFHPRCPIAMTDCSRQSPALNAVSPAHQVACLAHPHRAGSGSKGPVHRTGHVHE
jgi:peptide/nickel transport system ATP-binding protein